MIPHHQCQIQQQILRLQLRYKIIFHVLLLSSRDLLVVSRRGQVAHDSGSLWGWRRGVGCPEGTADENDGDGVGLFVGDGEDGGGGEAVDEFYAKDFGGGEGGGDFDSEVGGLGGLFYFFFWLEGGKRVSPYIGL